MFSGAPHNTSTNLRFAIQPLPGDTGFSQWVAAMKMVSQLPGGIPSEFRKRLWLTMADKHLVAKGIAFYNIYLYTNELRFVVYIIALKDSQIETKM